MKTAVSIPDDVFQLAERFAKRRKKSRSELYAEALREYLARRVPAKVTASINDALDELGEHADAEFATHAGRKTLDATEW